MTVQLPGALSTERADELASSIRPAWEDVFGPPPLTPADTTRPAKPAIMARAAALDVAGASSDAAAKPGAALGGGTVALEAAEKAPVAAPVAGATGPKKTTLGLGPAAGDDKAPSSKRRPRSRRSKDAVPATPASADFAEPSVRVPTSSSPIGKIVGGLAAVAAVVLVIYFVVRSDDTAPEKDAPTKADSQPASQPRSAEPQPASEPTEPEPSEAAAPEPAEPEPSEAADPEPVEAAEPEPVEAAEPEPVAPQPAPEPVVVAPQPTPKPQPVVVPKPTPKPGGDIITDVPF